MDEQPTLSRHECTVYMCAAGLRSRRAVCEGCGSLQDPETTEAHTHGLCLDDTQQTDSSSAFNALPSQVYRDSKSVLDGGWSKPISNPPLSAARHSGSRNNTENYVGTVKYPIGVIGPLKAHEQMQPPVNTQCTDGTSYTLFPLTTLNVDEWKNTNNLEVHILGKSWQICIVILVCLGRSTESMPTVNMWCLWQPMRERS